MNLRLQGLEQILAPVIWEGVFNVRKTLLIAVLALAACGDPDTTDDRGYTKAPLETPTVLVKGEPVSEMDRLGNPAYPAAPVIAAEPDTAGPVATAGGQTGGAPATPPAGGTPPAGATAADVSEGQKIFTSTGNCFTCHGQTGTGTGLAPALNDAQWINVDGSFASIQQVVNAGVPQPKQFPAPMPAKGGAALTDAQVKQVAAYVYSLSH
ncbi:MAG TPA: c-type cytochrome [Longimicrobiales bacterium]|nr:c-type cytochrome [Longimicrobiales bacterium]